MRGKKPSVKFIVGLAIIVGATLMTGTGATAQTENVLYNFNFNNNGAGGTDPVSNLIFDASGNLYGMTATGGDYGVGTVFKLSPGASGWTETVLHSFQRSEGANPGANGGLIFDRAGNLYGLGGGGAYGYGTVFELSPGAGGVWTLTVLHDFSYGGIDGSGPTGSLIFDGAGNLYGTTGWGGTGSCTSEFNLVGCGTVFELSPKAGGVWSEKVLHSFGHGTDGTLPVAGLVFDAAGNLYGVTYEGGTGSCLRGGNPGCGTVFELTPAAGGHWSEKILHNFADGPTDGAWPVGSLIFDAAGNLYGMTNGGGAFSWGTAYELMHRAGGGWADRVLYHFNEYGSSGASPYSGLIFDAAGNLYGTTEAYGGGGAGTAFKLTLTKAGHWTETTLHGFGSTFQDGILPVDSLIFDAAGNLYGTTEAGGTSTWGTVFEITP
jgi:uncharacterized repeat protein (TIGR03803 family)